MSSQCMTDGIEPLSRDSLIKTLSKGEKPKSAWRIGTEHEKFLFCKKTARPPAYEGECGVRSVLENLQRRTGWHPVMEGENIIGLDDPDTRANVSLEPAGQLELSGAALKTLHETCREVHTHKSHVYETLKDLDLGIIGLGFAPTWTREDMPLMPKARYDIMTQYMPKVGNHGIDMMRRTATVQVNLDFSSQVDMIKKMRVSLALQPVATALFAASPFEHGKPNGFLSYRSEVWKDVDQDRTGLLDFVFEDSFGYEQYVDWTLDAPMYFIKRDGRYHNVAGQSFRDFQKGKLKGFEGEFPTQKDWDDHLTTVFPEVRLKSFLEMRGADSGPWGIICALPAFWVGLLYDDEALDAAYNLIKSWSSQDRHNLRNAVPQKGLHTEIVGHSLREIAAEVLNIAQAGLKARNEKNRYGEDESGFLTPLQLYLERGETYAEFLLKQYETTWKRRITPDIFEKIETGFE